MNILYYHEPKSSEDGPDNVAYCLAKSLAKKVNITYFPSFTPRKGYPVNLLSVYTKFVTKGFDIFHLNFVPTWINGSCMLLQFAKKRDSHTVLNIHGIVPLEHKLEPALGPIPYMALSNTLRSCRVADSVVINSEYMRTKVVAWYGINSDKTVVIPNGVDLRMFSECKDRLALDGDPTILYLGHLSRGKGIDVLFQAIAELRSELPRMRLHIVGSGFISDYQLLAKKKGIDKLVVFHGLIPNSMVPCYYKSSDFCVFPSRHEGFGIVILEAMASGVPIIASDIGSFREILSNGKYGMLFKSGNASALSKAILGMHQDQGRRKKVAAAALEAVEAYSWENIAERYISLYHSLLVGSSNTK